MFERDQDSTFMARAITISRGGMLANEGGPFGAVIVKDRRIVGEGWNQVTSRNDPTAHAEVVAIRAACASLGTFKLEGATIYTSCEPCPMCLAAIYWARLGRIVYANSRADAAKIGFDDAHIYDEIPKPESERSLPIERLASEEASEVFRRWLEKSDRIAY